MEELLDIEARAAQQQQREERIARSVLDIDHFGTELARELARSKSAVVRELARDFSLQTQAVRLAIAMELHGERLRGPCDELSWTANQIQLLTSKSRLAQGSRLALALVIKLLAQVSADLSDWNEDA